MSNVQKCTNEVFNHRLMSDLREIIRDSHFVVVVVGVLVKYSFQFA